MMKGQAPGVERLSLEWNRAKLIRAKGIAHFANQRMAPKAGLNPDLIPLSCCQPHLDQAGGLE